MSDDESKKPEDEVPEGMVQKRRKVRRKRRAKNSNASANKVFSKGKDLLFGMQKQDDDEIHVDVAEQLRRLKRDKDEDKPLDDVWGTKRRSSSWLWILLLGIIMPLIVIGLIVAKLTQKPEEEAEMIVDGNIGIEEDRFSASDGPFGWFLGDSEIVTAEVIKILNALNEAQSVDEVMGYIRESPYRQLNPLSLEQFSNPFIAETISDFDLNVGLSVPGGSGGSGERGFLIVEGKHEDGQDFTAYFVGEEVNGEPRVLLDWDATIGWGEMSLAELIKTKPRKETLIRCLLEKKRIYDVELGDYQHSGYVISDPNSGEYVFVDVPLSNDRNKLLDLQLREALNFGKVLLPLKKDAPVTVRVRYGGDDAKSKIFEIVSLEHESWVRP